MSSRHRLLRTLNSIHSRWVFFSLGVVLLVTTTAGWVAYEIARDNIVRDSIRLVGMAARAREHALLALLERQNVRVEAFLTAVQSACPPARAEQAACIEAFLRRFVETEAALGARLVGLPERSVVVGSDVPVLAATAPAAGQLAQLARSGGGRFSYVVQKHRAGMSLALQFGVQPIVQVFGSYADLGGSGETFLADRRGFFVTPPRHPGTAGHSHPIDAAPMRACLAGQGGEMLALDYRGVPVVHGFRFIEQIGGACIMTHVEQAEVFAPVDTLRRNLSIVALLFMLAAAGAALLLAFRTTRPIAALTDRARALQHGDFDSPFPREGPTEIRTFSAVFAQMARSFKESEMRTRSVLENALDAVVGMDADGLTIDWNGQAEELFGWSRDEAVGQPMHQLLIPERYRQPHFDGLRRFLHTGQGSLLNRRVEISAAGRDGRELPVELTITPLRAAGSWVFYAFIRDLTAAKRAQEMQTFMAQASAMLAESLDFDVTIARVGRLAVPVLADFCTVLVENEDGVLQQVATSYADADEADRIVGHVQQNVAPDALLLGHMTTLQAGQPALLHELPEPLLRSLVDAYPALEPLFDQIEPTSFAAVPIQIRGRVVGAIALLTTQYSGRRFRTDEVAVAEELARRCAVALENSRLYREAQEAVELRDEFLSIASHELKTPLTPLLLRLQLFGRRIEALPMEESKRAWARASLSVLYKQGSRINRLVDELLDVARIQRGQLRLEPEWVDLAEVIEEVESGLASEGVVERSRISTKIDAASIVGHWDKLRLQQIVTNLLTNAAKYGAGTPIHVLAQLDGEDAVLAVRDFGPGIEPADQARIFDRLERAASARNYGGLGLGLYVSREAVRAMEGTISVESTPGRGACFTVRLPVAGPKTRAQDGDDDRREEDTPDETSTPGAAP